MAGAEIAQEIADALAEVGVEVGSSAALTATLTRPPDSPTATPWGAPSGTAEEWTVTILKTGPVKKLVDGTLVLTGDESIVMDALGPRPRPNDTLTIGSEVFTVHRVMAAEPAGVPLVYRLEVSR